MEDRLAQWRRVATRHLCFVGPGLVSGVAYIDPGNWATDLQAGAEYGYKLLFIVLTAGLMAVVLQTMAVRLGTVTSTSLAHQTREMFLRLEARYPRYRVPLHCCLWLLYILAEIAIIGTDLAELIGSAIALNLLFPALPLWGGVIITAADVLIILIFFNNSSGRQGMMFFELLIVALVMAVFISFAILLHLIKPEWREVFLGLVPSSTLVAPGAAYASIGIIGATVMPHALFLGSSLAGIDRLDMLPRPPVHPSERAKTYFMRKMRNRLGYSSRRKGGFASAQGETDQGLNDIELRPVVTLTGLAGPSVRVPPSGSVELGLDGALRSAHGQQDPMEQEQNVEGSGKDLVGTTSMTSDIAAEDKEYAEELERYKAELSKFDRVKWVTLHLWHASVDTIVSLLGFALSINASILTLAGAAFFYSDNGASADDATLQGAYALIRTYLGKGAALLFALALLFAGQSASITATLAGQVVSEGFINWKTSPFWRRLITRLIGVIPAAAVAASVGPAGLNTMLVASQVLLSIVLPTVIFPLVYICSRDELMSVKSPAPALAPAGFASQESQGDGERVKNFRNPVWLTWLGYALFVVLLGANVYTIVELGMGVS